MVSVERAGELVIGLEVHVQLAMRTKLFCRCPVEFGAAPNTQVCPTCLGLPGALPVMNERAVHLAIKAALAMNCDIPPFTKWDRKQYYYPDLPKGYQISQYDLPISQHGYLEISDPKQRFPSKKVGILRAHLEEDAGKSMHDEADGRGDSRIDLNRCGTPLLEIVSQPDLRSPLEARTFLDELKLLLTYLAVSDCNMQEGSLRVDANVNWRFPLDGETVATPIVEVKNMNSFRAVERALAYESDRQLEEWQRTAQRLGDVPKQTRGWDDQAEVTRPQRSKEESSDYRYFPDPDLVPLTPSRESVATIRDELGELPAELRTRLTTSYAITPYDADVLVNQGRELVDYFVAVAQLSGDAKQASNWIQRDVLQMLKERTSRIDEFPITADQLADLINAVAEGQLASSRAQETFAMMLAHGLDVPEAMDRLGVKQVDADELRSLCEQLLAAHPQIVQDVRDGKRKAVGALIGQAKQRNPNADPNEVREMCLRLITEMT